MRKKFFNLKQLKERVFKAYHKWIEIWNFIEINKLSSHRFIDYKVHFKEEAISLTKKIYNISKEQAFIIKKYIDEMLDKDYIKFNISFYAAFILIMKKFNEKL